VQLVKTVKGVKSVKNDMRVKWSHIESSFLDFQYKQPVREVARLLVDEKRDCFLCLVSAVYSTQ
jgi:hypothetical protein